MINEWAKKLQKNGLLIKDIPENEMNEELEIIAVKQNGYSIKYIKNPSFLVSFYAVQTNSLSLEFIDNSKYSKEEYEEICKEAIKKNKLSKKYIRN